MPDGRRLLCVLLPLLGLAAGDLTGLECPLPGGPDSADQQTCDLYSACDWTSEGRCVLNDQVGYVIESGPNPRAAAQTTDTFLTKKSDVTMFGDDIQRLKLTHIRYNPSTMGIAFRDAAADRYEVPVELKLQPPSADAQQRARESVRLLGEQRALLEIFHGDRQALQMLPQFIYSDQFIEASFLLGCEDIYGFGENNHDSFRHNLSAAITWPLFAHDHGPGDSVENLYGVHPFFLGIEDNTGKSFGMLFLNSNAMEYKLFYLDGQPALTFRTTGGILDMYVFLGNNPQQVLTQYHDVIGHPIMPPYWGLGFQLSRWGYTSLQDIKDTRARMKAAKIPQDIQYSDIDYMDGKRDFTYDQDKFSGLPEYIQQLREEEGVRFALIYDPAIAIDFGTYATVDRGVEQDVFVKWMNSSLVPDDQCTGCKDYVVSRVWPANRTLYPDFFLNRTVDWWTEEIRTFTEAVGRPDAFWIDMNEPSAFDTNIGMLSHNSLRWALHCPETKLDYPPYPINFVRAPFNPSKTLADHTICMSSQHRSDLSQGVSTYRHYDVHSLYGWSETRATRMAIDRMMNGRRSMLFGRSTYVGSGQWGSHWTGDNTARWKDMKRSVVRIMEFSMFGIAHVGADICGFGGSTTEELCLRWMQLGAFYPFSRNHNTVGAAPQDPASWPSVAAASRDALGLRYRLLPYLYTLFYEAQHLGATVARPLAFEFPTDRALRGVDTQFMLGPALMVAPVLFEDKMTEVEVTFPAGDWFDMRNHSLAYSDQKSATVHYDVSMQEMIPVFARGGTIIAMQQNETTTASSRKYPFKAAVFGSTAYGRMFWDDGESQNTIADERYYLVQYTFQNNTFSMKPSHNDTQWMDNPYLSELRFHGLSQEPSGVLADGTPISPDAVQYRDGLLEVQTRLHMGNEHQVRILY